MYFLCERSSYVPDGDDDDDDDDLKQLDHLNS
jgi:hypothetical protein